MDAWRILEWRGEGGDVKRCIGFGEREGRCYNDVLPQGPWCAHCNELRIVHLTKRFEEMDAEMKRRHP